MNRLKSYFLSGIVAILGMVCAGCNADVFIEPLEVGVVDFEIGPDNLHQTIAVTGTDWKISEVYYYGDDARLIFSEKDVPVHISTPFADISVNTDRGGVQIDLEYYLGTNDAKLNLIITNGIVYREVAGTVHPTDLYTVEIESVDYVLDQWSGYPDEDCTKRIGVVVLDLFDGTGDITVKWPVTSVPTTYKFESLTPGLSGIEIIDDPENYFANYVLNSGVKVPVPSTSSTPGEYWKIGGQELPLRLTRVVAYLSEFPPLPEPQTFPAGTKGSLYLCVRYESVGFQCTITARNPATKQPETIKCLLRILMPVELFNADETIAPTTL